MDLSEAELGDGAVRSTGGGRLLTELPSVVVSDPYEVLAGVYEWLVPEPLSTPEGSAAAFADVVADLDHNARILDCAAGTGLLAVGLALRGFDVVAADASRAMIERTRALAERYGVALPAVVCEWKELGQQGWRTGFDAVFFVGNSLTHAAGRAGRRAALEGMARVLREGGRLVLTSRNWERVRGEGSRLQVADRLVRRGDERALIIHSWTVPNRWEDEHFLDVAVAILGHSDAVTTPRQRLGFWPFRHDELDADLRATGFLPVASTYADELERYRVTARRH